MLNRGLQTGLPFQILFGDVQFRWLSIVARADRATEMARRTTTVVVY